MKNAKFTDQDKRTIRVETDDGQVLFVPTDPGNRHFIEIQDRKLKIADPDPPPPPGLDENAVIVATLEKLVPQAQRSPELQQIIDRRKAPTKGGPRAVQARKAEPSKAGKRASGSRKGGRKGD